MYKHKQELFKKLQHLGICFALMVTALVIASAWTSIASSAGLQPKIADVDHDGVTDDQTNDDGKDGATPGTGNVIIGTTAGDGIDDSTQQLNYFITSIIQWITGLAGAILGLGLVFIGIMHAKEDDPNKRD